MGEDHLNLIISFKWVVNWTVKLMKILMIVFWWMNIINNLNKQIKLQMSKLIIIYKEEVESNVLAKCKFC